MLKMKKILKNFVTLLLFAVLLVVTGCNLSGNDTSKTEEAIELKVFIPDYYAAAESARARAIAPQTHSIKLSYLKDSEWVCAGSVLLDSVEATPIEGAPQGFPGNNYNIRFSGIPVGTYEINSLHVELLNSEDEVITEAKNETSVTVVSGSAASAVFYTLPVTSSDNEGALVEGEMKFWSVTLDAATYYKLKVTVGEGDSYPDVVIFNSKGKIVKYYAIDTEEESEVKLTGGTSGQQLFVGVWANEGNISEYNLDISVEDSVVELSFGDSSTFDAEWTVTGNNIISKLNGAGVDGNSYAVYFDFKNLRKTTASLVRNVTINQSCILNFAIKTDIYYKYDGSVNFYIDDVLMSSFDGIGGDWNICTYTLPEGTHTIEWRAVGAGDSYTTGITNSVYLDQLSLTPIVIPSSFFDDFEADELNLIWGSEGLSVTLSSDESLTEWEQYGDAIKDTHGQVLKLASFDGSHTGNSSIVLSCVNPTEASTLSFDYKLDVWTDDYLRVYVDGEFVGSSYTGSGTGWKNLSVPIPAGMHNVKISLEKDSSYYGLSIKNAVYIDNVSVVPDEIYAVDIYPKGLQETYVGGMSIQFNAKAVREDGSVREGETFVWSCTGGTITQDGLFTPGSTAGTYSVSATAGDRTASNTTVKVHSENYNSDSVIIAGHEYTGAVTNVSGERYDTETIVFADSTPNGSSFDADGFFVLSGTVTRTDGYDNYGMVIVSKDDYQSTYFVKDTFNERIWLRFGAGTYTVSVCDVKLSVFDTEDPRYEGDFSGWTYWDGMDFTVNNVADDGLEADEACYLLPSYVCQSDNFVVSNVVNAVLAELPEDATVGEKLTALHDWEIHNLYYDNVSLNHSSRRKRQDAVHNILYGTCVCEGYANLYAAFARSVGIQTRYVSSSPMNHGWVNVLYKNQWKLVDVTWDDPVSSNSDSYCDIAPDAENYSYFMIALDGINGDHYSPVISNARSATGDVIPTKMKNMPDGWY